MEDWLKRQLACGDRAVVFTTFGGRFRSTLTGTVMRLATRLHEGERATVLLDQPTYDGFVVLDVPSSEVVSIDRKPAK
jgi:uncharacterized membrane protein YoaK (UPF0700 family)